MIIACPYCGAQAETEAVYCPNCHRNVAPGPEPEEERPAAPVVRRGELIGILAIIVIMTAGAGVVYSKGGPVRRPGSDPALTMQCMSNLKQLSTAAIIYQGDNSGHNFPGSNYLKALRPYVKGAIDECPESGMRYAVNDKLLGIHVTAIKDHARTAWFYDGVGAKIEFLHGGYAIVAFADSSTKKIVDTTKVSFDP